MISIPVFLFMDAMGWEIVQRHHFLENELPFRYPVQMQFGYSSTAIPTILSGEYPERHNHFSFFYYDPEHSPFKSFRFLKYIFGAGQHPNSLLNRGRVRAYISKLFGKWKGYTGYFQLYSVPYAKLPYLNYCEKEDIFAPHGLAPIPNLRDTLDKSGLRFLISNWHRPESENIDEAEKALLNHSIDFAFIYTASFDAFLHDHVKEENVVDNRIRQYEKRLQSLLENLKKNGIEIRFTIISDHGMTPLKATVDIMQKVEQLGLNFSTDYAAVYDSTMARFWYMHSKAKEVIQNRLMQSDCQGVFVTDTEKKQYGIQFENNKFGDDIFLMNPGIQIIPSDMGHKPLNGMHGYSPKDKDSFAAFLSNTRPSFIPRDVKDYFALMKETIERMQTKP